MLLEITGIGSEMQGIGRGPDGRVVFVPFALPGEQIEAKIVKETDRFLIGRLEKVVRASKDRVVPLCPLYGRCGGCRTQHMTYSCALALKRQVVFQQVERIGNIPQPNVRPTLASGQPWRYRNKAEFSVQNDIATRTPVVGMCAMGSRQVLQADDCLIQSEDTVRVVRIVSKWMQIYCVPAWDAPEAHEGGVRYVITRVNHAGDLMVIVSTTGRTLRAFNELFELLCAQFGERIRSLNHIALEKTPAHALDGRCVAVRGRHMLHDQLMGLSFEMSPKTFFQVNHEQTEVLYDCVRKAAALTGNELVIDAYCGCGTISLVLARAARRVIGVELNEAAVSNAFLNAKRNKLDGKTEFHAGDAGVVVTDMLSRGVKPDVMVVDPPRKGVDVGLLDAILRAGVPRIVYVSCNPGTLARDLRTLTDNGDYKLESVQPLDMFPQTEHVEAVCLLTHD